MPLKVRQDQEAGDIDEDQVEAVDCQGNGLEWIAPQQCSGEGQHADKEQPDEV